MYIKYRKHHRRQCLARDTEGEQRDHRRRWHRIVGSLGCDQPFGRAMAKFLGRLRGLLRIGVGHELRHELPHSWDHPHQHAKAG